MTRRPPVLLDFVVLIAVMQLLQHILELLRNRFALSGSHILGRTQPVNPHRYIA